MSGVRVMEFTKKETAWLDRYRKTMKAAPKTLNKKVSSYTIGDNEITLYDLKKFEEYFRKNPLNSRDVSDHCQLVDKSDSKIESFSYPFAIESTAG